jgi:L-asparaginase
MSNKKILVIITGGTFASIEKDGVRSLDDLGHFSNWLNSETDLLKLSCTMEIACPLYTFSENMTIQKWSAIFKFLKTKLSNESFDGIIFTHGSDTLAYSACMIALITQGLNIPIVFVASAQPVGLPGSNGWTNFKAALNFIANTPFMGTYVAYSDDNIDTNIYVGERIMQSQVFVDRYFSFAGLDFGTMPKIGKFSPKDFRLGTQKLSLSTASPLIFDQQLDFDKLKSNILLFSPYVGLDFDMFNLDKIDTIIINPYHSATYCSLGDGSSQCVNYLVDKCKGRNIPIILSPCRQNSPMYTKLEHDIIRLPSISSEATYCKVLLANIKYQIGSTQWLEFLKTPIAFEFIN